MDVYFATNRNLHVSRGGSATARTRGPKFGIHPADFRVGVATVDIERAELVRGERMDDTAIYRSAKLESEARRQGRITRRGSAELFRRIANILAGNGDDSTRPGRRSILVFIPGFNNSFEESITGGATLANLYSSDDHQLVPFVFSWPSDGEFGVYYYRSDRKDAECSADAGARVLDTFLKYVNGTTSPEQCTSSAFLFTHSMGAHVLRFAVQELLRRLRQTLPRSMVLRCRSIRSPPFCCVIRRAVEEKKFDCSVVRCSPPCCVRCRLRWTNRISCYPSEN